MVYTNSLNIKQAGLVYFNTSGQFSGIDGTSTGQFLRWNGTTWAGSSNVLPDTSAQGDIFYSSATNTISALAKNTTATRYLSNTGTSNNPAWAQIALSTGVTGTLPLANGGTNAALTASNGGIFYSTGTAGAILAGTATAGQVLRSGSSSAPSWSTATFPNTTTANQLLYSLSANSIGGLSTANNGLLVTSATGVPSIGNVVGGSFGASASSAGSDVSVTTSNTSTSASSNAVFSATVGSSTSGDPYSTYIVSGVTTWSAGVDNSATVPSVDPYVISPAGSLGTNDCVRIATTGAVTLPRQPGCAAYVASTVTNVTGNGDIYTVLFNNELYDPGTNYDPATGIFTCPVAGRYLVNAQVTFTSLSALYTLAELRLASTTYSTRAAINIGAVQSSGLASVFASQIFQCSAADTLRINVLVSGSAKTIGVQGDNFGAYSFLSIQLLA